LNIVQPSSRPKIIYVDDEAFNLDVFKMTIRDDAELFLFTDPFEALKQIKEISPWVIFTDQSMPKMRGTEFIREALKISPQSSSIIVSGHVDESSLIQCINELGVSGFIRKPILITEVESVLVRALEKYHQQVNLARAKLVIDRVKEVMSEKANTCGCADKESSTTNNPFSEVLEIIDLYNVC
jgi:response regulator RpfG family c-di-GMP phosphodiesterase